MALHELDDNHRGLFRQTKAGQLKQATDQLFGEELFSKIEAILTLETSPTANINAPLFERFLSYCDADAPTISMKMSGEELEYLYRVILNNSQRDRLNMLIRNHFDDDTIELELLPEISFRLLRVIALKQDLFVTAEKVLTGGFTGSKTPAKTTHPEDRYFSPDGYEYKPEDVYRFLGSSVQNNGAVFVFSTRRETGLPDYKKGVAVNEPVKLINPDGTAISFSALIQMATLVCGECAGLSEGFLHTAHTIRNRQVLREFAKRSLPEKSKASSRVRSDLHAVLNSCVHGPEYSDIEEYCKRTPWEKRHKMTKAAAIAACLNAITRSPNNPEEEKKLIAGGWHPLDPGKGAIAWRGSRSPVGPRHPRHKSPDAYKTFYRSMKLDGIPVWDLPDDARFVTFSNGVMAVYQKHSPQWIIQNAKNDGLGLILQGL